MPARARLRQRCASPRGCQAPGSSAWSATANCWRSRAATPPPTRPRPRSSWSRATSWRRRAWPPFDQVMSNPPYHPRGAATPPASAHRRRCPSGRPRSGDWIGACLARSAAAGLADPDPPRRCAGRAAGGAGRAGGRCRGPSALAERRSSCRQARHRRCAQGRARAVAAGARPGPARAGRPLHRGGRGDPARRRAAAALTARPIQERADRYMVSLPSFLRPWRRRAPAIPAVRLAGVIGSVGLAGRGLTLAGLERTLDAAFAHKHAPAVALLINSPGGSPVQSALIAGRIRDLAGRRTSRCWPSSRTSRPPAATGSPAPPTRSSPTRPRSWARSAWSAPASASRRRSAASGIERRVHATGDRKALLDPFKAERPDDLELLREIQGDILARFVAHVRDRRGDRLKGSDAELFDGRVWTGDGALGHGLIDGLGEARATIRARYRPGCAARRGQSSTRPAAPVAFARRACAYSGRRAGGAGSAGPLAPVRDVAAHAVEQMFSLSFGKILVTVLVVVAAWRGYRHLPADAGPPRRRQRARRAVRRSRRSRPTWSNACAAACSCRTAPSAAVSSSASFAAPERLPLALTRPWPLSRGCAAT